MKLSRGCDRYSRKRPRSQNCSSRCNRLRRAAAGGALQLTERVLDVAQVDQRDAFEAGAFSSICRADLDSVHRTVV
jgi:hypothetical protein